MQFMPVMLASMCHSGGGTADWMLISSWIGMFACGLISVFHGSRILFLRNASQSIDLLAESCHTFMGIGMAYMFAPFAAIKVIPDTFWALSFAVLALAFAVRPLIRKNHALGDVAHSVMNLSMTYMFMQSLWDAPVVTATFVALFTAYATLHGAEFLKHWKERKAAPKKASLLTEPAMSAVSHIVMSGAMVFMFLMPAMMATGMEAGAASEVHGCCSDGKGSCCSPKSPAETTHDHSHEHMGHHSH